MTAIKTDLLVIGSGPGGYAAAFRAADLGLTVTLIEKHATLGGVCLNVGCIPSKALLHVAETIHEIAEADAIGVMASKPEIDLDKIREFKNQSVGKLPNGIEGMAKGRNVHVINGIATFISPSKVEVANQIVEFEKCIIAAGSSPVTLPFIPHDDDRVWNSTDALELKYIPEHLVIMGGGIIGLEMATIYQALGSKVTIVEYADQLIPAADADLIKVYQRFNQNNFAINVRTKVTAVTPNEKHLAITVEDQTGESTELKADALLVAVGRTPNGHKLNADKAGVHVDEKGFIPVNDQMQTNVPHVFAIGDINGNPMLAHKASHEGHVAAEVAAGHKAYFEPITIPSIAYTNPEIAWTGLTEKEAKAKGLNIKTAVFPWSASGRAIGANRSEGKTKLIYDAETETILGGGIVGKNAGELLGELTLALEFQACVEDIALTIHAHPTLHETVGLAAELAAGSITDLPNPTRKKKA